MNNNFKIIEESKSKNTTIFELPQTPFVVRQGENDYLMVVQDSDNGLFQYIFLNNMYAGQLAGKYNKQQIIDNIDDEISKIVQTELIIK